MLLGLQVIVLILWALGVIPAATSFWIVFSPLLFAIAFVVVPFLIAVILAASLDR